MNKTSYYDYNMKEQRCAPYDSQCKVIYGTDSPIHCYKILPIENFGFRYKSKGIRHRRCIACTATHRKTIKGALKEKINEIKSNSPCVDCGGIFHPVAMDFDHVRGTKKCSISNMTAKTLMSWDKIQKEIENCDIRCSNCHRIKSYEESLQRASEASGPEHTTPRPSRPYRRGLLL